MPKYLVTGSYSADGAKGLMAEGGTNRLAAATAAIESIGGAVEAFYYAFGETDVFGICDFPDNAAATAASLVI
ncbi:MAG: GYD domain-containing protein, partial [Ilumatobacteraceae bacterium]